MLGVLFSVHSNLTSQPASQLVSALINGCGAQDGTTEYMVVYSGSSSFTASTSSMDIQYSATTIANLVTITDSFLAAGNSTFVASLNALLTGCDFTFINAIPGSTSIPAGSHILILNDDIASAIDFSAWCGQSLDNVYVLFSDDTSWPATGTFENTPASDRLLRSIVNGTQTDFSYGNNWASDVDGNYVQWNDGGGAGSIYSNYSGCAPSDTNSLPVSLLDFNVHQQGNRVIVQWVTGSEVGNSHFTLFRSQNGRDWIELKLIAGKGDSDYIVKYKYSDTPLLSGRYYYKLKQTDFNGDYEYFSLVKIDFIKQDIKVELFPNPARDFVFIRSDEHIEKAIFTNLQGQSIELKPSFNDVETSHFELKTLNKGLYSILVMGKVGPLIKKVIVVN
jgi:hypothetical protein